MTLYSDLIKQDIINTGFSSGLTTTQQAFQNITQSGTVLVTHDEDTNSSRIVQIVEFKPEEDSIVDTTLDFDLSDEGNFIQEDSSIGTDFVDGQVFLHKIIGNYNEQQKIQASDLQGSDYFGQSVSIYGDTAIVGAYIEDAGGLNAGAAYIFTRSGSTWTEQQKIQASDAQAGDNFGRSVSIHGDTAIVGASYEDTGAANAGAAYIFTRSGSTWTEQQKIQASDAQAGDYFGQSVSIYGDTAIVGANYEDTGASDAGAAYIFTRSGSTWTEQQKIQASDAQASDSFGQSVSIHGDTAIVGAYIEDTGAANAGAAYIFSSVTYPITPYYVTTSDINHLLLGNVTEINSCVITNTSPTNTTIKGLVSFDSRSTWEKWGGSSWTTHTGGLSNLQTGNTITELQTGFTNLTIASGINNLDFAFDLGTTNSGVTPSVDLITVDYDEEGYYKLNISDYETEYYSSTITMLIKNSVGAKNIKVNVVI